MGQAQGYDRMSFTAPAADASMASTSGTVPAAVRKVTGMLVAFSETSLRASCANGLYVAEGWPGV